MPLNLALADLVVPYVLRAQNLAGNHPALSFIRVVSFDVAADPTGTVIHGRCELPANLRRFDPLAGVLQISLDENDPPRDAAQNNPVFDFRETSVDFELFVPRLAGAIVEGVLPNVAALAAPMTAWAATSAIPSDHPATAPLRAPFRGILAFEERPTFWSGVDGLPLAGQSGWIAVLRLHPEAARRLERLLDARHGTAAMISAPIAMVIRNLPAPAVAPVPNWYQAGETLVASTGAGTPAPAPVAIASAGGGAVVSFHDARGLPIDPVAVAGLLLDLFTTYPPLQRFDPSVTAADLAIPGAGLTALAGMAKLDGVRVHVIDPHGWPFQSAAGTLKLDSGQQTPDAGGLIDLPAGSKLVRGPGDDAARPIRFGWARGGRLDSTALAPPVYAQPTPPARRFVRMMAVDLAWHLLGNRADTGVAPAAPHPAIPADDMLVRPFALPKVRAAVPGFAYLSDPMQVLGAMGALVAAVPAPPVTDGILLAVSPELDPTVPAPPTAAARWPSFPPWTPPPPQPAPPPGTKLAGTLTGRVDLRGAVSAAWADATAPGAVVVTIAAGALADELHVRVHPRLFVEIATIEPGMPSFRRGDGASAITKGGGATKLLLAAPFGPNPGKPAALDCDVVVADRNGNRRLFSQLRLPLDPAATEPPPPPPIWGGAALLPAALTARPDLLWLQSIAPSALFGVPGAVASGAGALNLAALLKALTSEGSPRQGPRLPTQARFETILAFGQRTGGAAGLAFDAVLTGARIAGETRCRRPESGDPGNPAGPDVYAAGIRCGGALAYDLAFRALKRTLPMAAFDKSGSPFGWVLRTAGDDWNPPAADTGGTVSAAMLETVAAGVDSPEFMLLPGDGSQPIASIASYLPAGFTVSLANEPAIRARLDRELATARYGQRDALWSLVRAIAQAREFVYIETAAFARTARGTAANAHAIDLVETLRAALKAHPRLKLVVCVPRMPDFATPAHANWELTALALRYEPLDSLIKDLPGRVAAFHPIGFPGRDPAIRTTSIIVDDGYALVGTSHVRRRGMTFDGACDIASIDRQMVDGYSGGVARFRRELMAAKLGVELPTGPADTSALWVRLASTASAFAVVADLLAEGGGGRIAPVWAGPAGANGQPSSTIPASDALVDPDGGPGGGDLFELFKTLS